MVLSGEVSSLKLIEQYIYMHFLDQHVACILCNAVNFDNVCILYQMYVSNISRVLQDML